MRFRISCSAAKFLFKRRKSTILYVFERPAQTEPPGREPTEKENIMFTALVRFIQSWKNYNRSLNELSRLGDRELADIGVSRSDIPRLAWNAAQQR